MDGILNILKPPGMTSFDVVAVARHFLGAKTGHCGTLDPAASGVLPVCSGKATRLIEYIEETEKAYTAELTLGVETDTYDSEGDVTAKSPVTVDREAVERAVSRFVGPIAQVPPMHSAIKINGKRLYDLARAGITVERAARNITIHSINVREFGDGGRILIDVKCSKGTYIRSLCHDIGRELGCGAHMSFLVRTAAGNFNIADALPIAELAGGDPATLESALLPPEAAITGLAKLTLDDKALAGFLNGRILGVEDCCDSEPGERFPENAAVTDRTGRLIGIAVMEIDGKFKLKAGKLLI